MATIEDTRLLKSLLSSIQTTFGELDELDSSLDLNQDISGVLSSFRQHFTKLSRLTYNGDLSPAFRRKLEKVRGWLAGLDSALEKEQNFKTNKNSLLVMTEVEKYREYCEKIVNFFDNVFPRTWASLDKKNSHIEEKFSNFGKKLKNFEEPGEVDTDLLRDDDGKMELVEPKVVGQIKSTVKDFAELMRKINSYKLELNANYEELMGVKTADVFRSRTKKAQLLNSLLKNFQQLNKLIYQANFSNALLVRQKYSELLEEAKNKYEMPPGFNNLFLDSSDNEEDKTIKEKLQEDRKNPEKAVDTFVSPFQKKNDGKQNGKEPIPAFISKLSPGEKARYEKLWNDPQITPEEKKKFEALWAFRRAFKLFKSASRVSRY